MAFSLNCLLWKNENFEITRTKCRTKDVNITLQNVTVAQKIVLEYTINFGNTLPCHYYYLNFFLVEALDKTQSAPIGIKVGLCWRDLSFWNIKKIWMTR